MKNIIKPILSFFSIRTPDNLRPLERCLLRIVADALPPHLGQKLDQQIEYVKYIDRFEPKHYINCFPGKAGYQYPEAVLFPLRTLDCEFANLSFTIQGIETEFLAKLFAVRGAFFSFEITPYFEKIAYQHNLEVRRIRVFPEMLADANVDKA